MYAVSVSDGVVLCGVASWAEDQPMMLPANGNGSEDDTVMDAALRRKFEAGAAGLDDSQCERHPLCVRGFKHGGRGGHCALPAGASAGPSLSAKRARHLRLIELNSTERIPKAGRPLTGG